MFTSSLVSELNVAKLILVQSGNVFMDKSHLKQLIEDLHSEISTQAQAALEALQASGWMTDGSLRGINFDNVNWQGLDLRHADLRNCSLINANLRRTNLIYTHLEGADLTDANLLDASVFYKIPGVGIGGVRVDETTTAPDGTPCPSNKGLAKSAQYLYWRFCRSQSKEIWRSIDPASPAFDEILYKNQRDLQKRLHAGDEIRQIKLKRRQIRQSPED